MLACLSAGPSLCPPQTEQIPSTQASISSTPTPPTLQGPQGYLGKPQACGEGAFFLGKEALGHSSSLLTGLSGQGSGHLEKPKPSGRQRPREPWASLSSSLPATLGAQEPMLGKGAVPNLCPGTTASHPAEKGLEAGQSHWLPVKPGNLA